MSIQLNIEVNIEKTRNVHYITCTPRAVLKLAAVSNAIYAVAYGNMRTCGYEQFGNKKTNHESVALDSYKIGEAIYAVLGH